MTLNDAIEWAKRDADNYNEPVAVVYDQLLQEEHPYTCCGVRFLDHFYPETLKDYWNVVDVFEPKTKKRFYTKHF